MVVSCEIVKPQLKMSFYYREDLLKREDEVGIAHLDAWATKLGVPGYVYTNQGTNVTGAIKYASLQVEDHIVLVCFNNDRAHVYDSWPNDAYHEATVERILKLGHEMGVDFTAVTWADELEGVPKQRTTSVKCGYYVARALATVPFGEPVRGDLPTHKDLNEALKEFGTCLDTT